MKEKLIQIHTHDEGSSSILERESTFSACDTDQTSDVTWGEVELCEVHKLNCYFEENIVLDTMPPSYSTICEYLLVNAY